MAFDPENPVSPFDLVATFTTDKKMNALVYTSPDEGVFTRINGDWVPMNDVNNPYGVGVEIVCVDPSFIMEYDSVTMYNEDITAEDVINEFGVDPGLNIKF